MASRLELSFDSFAVENQQITISSGKTYTFKVQRTGFRQVDGFVVEGDPYPVNVLADNFFNAFKTDDNYLGIYGLRRMTVFTDVNGNALGPGESREVVIIRHPDNNHFDSLVNTTSFISTQVTILPDEVTTTLDVTLGQSSSNACEKVNINVKTSATSGRIVIEIPAGNIVANQVVSGAFDYNLDRNRSSASTGGIVRYYETETAKIASLTRPFTVPGILTISEVEVLSSPFGATANIKASGTNLEYSLNNTTWKSSSEFPGLLEGSHTAYVRDSFGCVKTYAFQVSAENTQGISVPPMIHFPIHNSLRAVYRGREIFTGFTARETPGITPVNSYYQPYLVGDTIPMQFKSSYPTANHRAILHDCHGNQTELFIQKLSNNISRVNIYEGNYTTIDGKLAVYFTAGNIYNPDGTVQDYGHNLNGLLPKWYQSNVFLNIEGLGVTRIDKVFFDDDEEIVYAVTELEPNGDVFNVQITSIHTENPYEIYEFTVDLFAEGEYVLEVDYGGVNTIWFEPVQVKTELPDRYLKVQWYSDENNDIIYNTGIKQMRRLPWVKYFTYKSTVEKKIFKSDTTVRNIRSKSYATYEIAFRPMPMEMARGIDYAFNAAGGVVEINGALFVCDGAVSVDPVGSYYKVTAELTLIGQSMSSPQYGVGDAFLIVDENANGVAFLRI